MSKKSYIAHLSASFLLLLIPFFCLPNTRRVNQTIKRWKPESAHIVKFRLARTTVLSEKLPLSDGELQLAQVNTNVRKAAQKSPNNDKRY
jgi:hypothetical protein